DRGGPGEGPEPRWGPKFRAAHHLRWTASDQAASATRRSPGQPAAVSVRAFRDGPPTWFWICCRSSAGDSGLLGWAAFDAGHVVVAASTEDHPAPALKPAGAGITGD